MHRREGGRDCKVENVKVRGKNSKSNAVDSCKGELVTMIAPTARIFLWMIVLTPGVFISGICVANRQEEARSPEGYYQCRNWERQPTTLLAVLVLHKDGTYEAIDRLEDLQADRPTTTGRYTYDESKQQIDWTSGEWSNRLGLYMPNVKGTDFIVIHTKRDVQGKVDGTLRCARSPSRK